MKKKTIMKKMIRKKQKKQKKKKKKIKGDIPYLINIIKYKMILLNGKMKEMI